MMTNRMQKKSENVAHAEDGIRLRKLKNSGRLRNSPPTGQYKVLFHLAGFTGLRSGELVGLRVEDLKLEHGVIEVRRSVWNGIEGEPKPRSGKRDVFIDSVTVRLLCDFLAGRPTGRVFQSCVGTPLENRDICRRVLKPLCKQLGIEPGGMQHRLRQRAYDA
jgi:integrase